MIGTIVLFSLFANSMINYSYAQSMPATLPISPKIPAPLQTPGLLGTLKASHVPVPPNRPSNTTITRDSNSEYSIPSTFVKIDRFSSNYTIAGEISSISASRELITSTIVHDFDKDPNIGYVVYNSSSLISPQPSLPNPFVNIDTINHKITNETQNAITASVNNPAERNVQIKCTFEMVLVDYKCR